MLSGCFESTNGVPFLQLANIALQTRPSIGLHVASATFLPSDELVLVLVGMLQGCRRSGSQTWMLSGTKLASWSAPSQHPLLARQVANLPVLCPDSQRGFSGCCDHDLRKQILAPSKLLSILLHPGYRTLQVKMSRTDSILHGSRAGQLDKHDGASLLKQGCSAGSVQDLL